MAAASDMSVFDNALAFSKEKRHNPLWEEAGKRYFGDKDVIIHSTEPVNVSNDRGMDLIIDVPSRGKLYKIDTKFHRYSGRAFGDDKVYIEYKHTYPDNSFKKVGWVAEEGKVTDYLFYAKQENGVVYIFPFHDLQRAWRDNKDTWLQGHGTSTPNTDSQGTHIYTSHCVLVSAEEIYKALGQNFTVRIPDTLWAKC